MRLVDADTAPKYLNTIACKQILNMPTVEAVPVKHGEWKKEREYSHDYYCSEYKESSECKTAYCANCGAVMDKNKKEVEEYENKVT